MALVQKLQKSIMPREMAEAMEAESRLWMMRCPDGHETSVWDAGGIRYRAAGKPVRLYRCGACGELRKMTLHKATSA